MDYMQEPFPFPPQHQSSAFFQAVPYPPYMVHPQQQFDDYYGPYGAAEYADLMAAGMMHDDYRDMDEAPSRPRLTKEQFDILEAKFQENHKPNSQVKRQLAIQTNLKIQRVGNWFQNRRAKAKHEKKREEYEAQNAAKTDDNSKPGDANGATVSTTPKQEIASPTRSVASPKKEEKPITPTSPIKVKIAGDSKEAGWASLQRALGQAKAAHAQQAPQPEVTMPPPQSMSTTQLPLRVNGHQPSSSTSSISKWSTQHASAVPYPSPITLQDTSFDFGFDQDVLTNTSSQANTAGDPIVDYVPEPFVVTPEDWQETLTTPTGHAQQQNEPVAVLPSPGLTMPSYPSSRRQSTTEELSNNFGNFALVSSSPNVPMGRRGSQPFCPPHSGPLDIAARRKRPRPAALTSASLRSRSYGALTSVSPTFRQGVMTPPVPHAVRHVKSAGQSLNSRYAGIRKASSAQRSPMCVPNFAEAEAFDQLMAQQAAAAQSLADLPAPMLSPDLYPNDPMTDPEKNPYFAQSEDLPHQFSMPTTQNLAITTTSPPITPLVPDFMAGAQSQQSLVPPASAPPQYASFPDYTPPYSAGPLTNSSWPDAPLTSPDVPSFPPVTYVPSLGYPSQSDGPNGPFQQFILPSDNKSDLGLDLQADQRKTEFYIQEFPNQKEEHAHVAQQLAQQKPKNYVFANTAPQDYSGL
ncbi:uncharacterized protein Z518_01899 [Rhinocladiella mackenziei CBS 650.93]|uniref:Homeobox domain-containing protein n=1 Tax=Rhinocladiella mackenziei CBS 650.93 TaxID=1442369 RepID=A0A0D2IVL3_9EURO|nr:uncharacterized protein Z518_01899 [Rhinocladiella mackenziei CBS 650.93]KIX07246.1 hypothetical protein Z518_01899 [Rhinocladiella mackenziei CBS 650.93]